MLVFPSILLAPSKLGWSLAGTPITGGQPVSGPSYDGDLSGGGWWEVSHEISRVASIPGIRLWRAVASQLKNGATPVSVPVIDWGQPWPGGAPQAQPLTGFSDGTAFGDGAQLFSNTISASLVGDTPLRSVSATIRIAVGAGLQGGEYFTLVGLTGYPRLHLIGSAVRQANGDWAVGFIPPLREDYHDGVEVDFQRPRCAMKLDSRSIQSVWGSMQAPFFLKPSATFRETWPETDPEAILPWE